MKTSQVNIRNCEPVNTESIQPSKIKKTVIAASGIAAAAGIGVAATIVAQKIGADEPIPEISENMDSSEAVTPVEPAGDITADVHTARPWNMRHPGTQHPAIPQRLPAISRL